MDYTLHEILQARTLEWGAFPFSRGSSQPRVQTQVSHIAGGFFTSHKGRILWMKSAYKIENMWKTDTHVTTQSPSPHAWGEVTVTQQRRAHFPGYPPLPSLPQWAGSSLASPPCDAQVPSVPAGLTLPQPGRPAQQEVRNSGEARRGEEGPCLLYHWPALLSWVQDAVLALKLSFSTWRKENKNT